MRQIKITLASGEQILVTMHDNPEVTTEVDIRPGQGDGWMPLYMHGGTAELYRYDTDQLTAVPWSATPTEESNT